MADRSFAASYSSGKANGFHDFLGLGLRVAGWWLMVGGRWLFELFLVSSFRFD